MFLASMGMFSVPNRNNYMSQAFLELYNFISKKVDDIDNFNFPLFNLFRTKVISYCYNFSSYVEDDFKRDLELLKCNYDTANGMPPYEAVPFLSFISALTAINNLIISMNTI